MYDFEKKLFPGEKILYQGKGTPGKGERSIGGLLFVIAFCLIIQAVVIWSVNNGIGDGQYGIGIGGGIIFGFLVLFEILMVYNLIDLLFIKNRLVANSCYCLTNQRAMTYYSHKNQLVYGFLNEFDDINCSYLKGKHGDVYLGISLSENGEISIERIKRRWFDRNPQQMPIIIFKSIENPRKIEKLAKKARNEL